MRKWLRRARGALKMGLTWLVPWAGLGFLFEIFVDPHGKIADIWPAVFGLPAFFGGVFFSIVLGIAERRRKFDELSIPRFAVWGAVAGLLVGALPIVLSGFDAEAWRAAVTIGPAVSLLTAASAAGSLALARKGDAQPVGSGEDIASLREPSSRVE